MYGFGENRYPWTDKARHLNALKYDFPLFLYITFCGIKTNIYLLISLNLLSSMSILAYRQQYN